MGDGNVTGLPSQGAVPLAPDTAAALTADVVDAGIRGDPVVAGMAARDAAGRLTFLTATDPTVPAAAVLAASTPPKPDGYLGADPLWEPHLRKNRARIRGVADIVHVRWHMDHPTRDQERPTVLVLGSGTATDFDLPHLAARFNVILVDIRESFFADALAKLADTNLGKRVRTVTDDVTGIMAELDRQMMSGVDPFHMPTPDEFIAHIIQVLQSVTVPIPDFSKYADGHTINMAVSSSLLSQLHEILDNELRIRLMQMCLLGDMGHPSAEAMRQLARALQEFSGKLVAAHKEGLARLVKAQHATAYLSTDMGIWPASQDDVVHVHSRPLIFAKDGMGLYGLRSLFSSRTGMTLIGPAKWLWHTEARVVRPYEALVLVPNRVAEKHEHLFKNIISPVYPDIEKVARTPAVQNQLLLKEQVVYQMAWKQLVNPDSRPITVVYNAMGADVSTVLLATNATTIIGLDNRALDVGKITENLLLGEEMDGPARRIAESFIFDDEAQLRREQGFWSESTFDSFGIERLLVFELKCLGVDLSTVQVSASGDVITIIFQWAYPGEEPKERRIAYMQGNLSKLVTGALPIAIDKIDGLYQKAANHPDPQGYRNIWAYLAPHLGPSGFVLMGTPEYQQEDHLPDHDERLRLLGPQFQGITVAEPYAMAMSLAMGELDYGQKLFGYKKSGVGRGGSIVAESPLVSGGEVLVAASGVASGEIMGDALVGLQFTAPVEDAVVGADLCVRPAVVDTNREAVAAGELVQEGTLEDAATTPDGLATHLGASTLARPALVRVVVGH